MKSPWVGILCFVLPVLVTGCAAQPAPAAAQPASAQPSVTFLFEWNQAKPWINYSIHVQADGMTHFEGDPNPADGGDTDPFQQDFTMSDANRQKIFELAKKARYFNGDFDFHKKIAQTGKKTLQYRSPDAEGSTTYNWSQNTDIQQLTKLFESIATTLDYGRKLAFLYRFDKLGMDQCLKDLEQMQSEGFVEELPAIEPILRKISVDPNLMNISRQSAKHLLKSMGSAASAANNVTQP
jgi:hypothetical protein